MRTDVQQAWDSWAQKGRKSPIKWYEYTEQYYVVHVLTTYILPFFTDEMRQRLARGAVEWQREIPPPSPYLNEELLSIVRGESCLTTQYRTLIITDGPTQRYLEQAACRRAYEWVLGAVLGDWDLCEVAPDWRFPGEVIARLDPAITGHSTIIQGIKATFLDRNLTAYQPKLPQFEKVFRIQR